MDLNVVEIGNVINATCKLTNATETYIVVCTEQKFINKGCGSLFEYNANKIVLINLDDGVRWDDGCWVDMSLEDIYFEKIATEFYDFYEVETIYKNFEEFINT